MAGVGGQVDRHLLAGGGDEGALGAEVVLHVARALHGLRVLRALELAEDLAVGLAGDVGQHVEAAAVGHADRDLVEAGLGRALQDLVEQRDGRLAALEAEALLADVLRLQEGLEGLGLVQLAQDAQLLVVRRLLVLLLEPLLEPEPLLGILDVHVLDAVVRQYESRSTPRISRSSAARLPPKPPVTNSRSRSQKVRPWLPISRSGCVRCLYSSGSMSAIRWPRTRNELISSCTRAVLPGFSARSTEMSSAQWIGS